MVALIKEELWRNYEGVQKMQKLLVVLQKKLLRNTTKKPLATLKKRKNGWKFSLTM